MWAGDSLAQDNRCCEPATILTVRGSAPLRFHHDPSMTLPPGNSRSRRRAIASLAVCLVLQSIATLAGAQESLLGGLEGIESSFRNESAGADNSPALRVEIDRIVGNLGSPCAVPGGPDAVRGLNRLIFDQLQIRPSQNLKDADNLLPSRV